MVVHIQTLALFFNFVAVTTEVYPMSNCYCVLYLTIDVVIAVNVWASGICTYVQFTTT